MNFKWRDEYSVKVPLIDEQHKRLFEIGQEIVNLIGEDRRQDKFDESVALIEELKAYTVYHFQQEENMMKLYGYENLQQHMIEHAYFIDYLNNIDYEILDDFQCEGLNELMKFVASWILKHIMSEDFKYSDLLASSVVD